MKHSPATILANLLADHSSPLFTMPDEDSNGAWPVFVSSEPPAPDECATLSDTPGMNDGRTLDVGLNLFRYGFQLRVRSNTYNAGWEKISDFVLQVSTIHNEEVTIDSSVYLVDTIVLSTPPFALGIEQGSLQRREIFTINGFVMIRNTNT